MKIDTKKIREELSCDLEDAFKDDFLDTMVPAAFRGIIQKGIRLCDRIDELEKYLEYLIKDIDGDFECGWIADDARKVLRGES